MRIVTVEEDLAGRSFFPALPSRSQTSFADL
jgi:hypothetical protein